MVTEQKKEKIIKAFLYLTTSISIIALLSIVIYIVINGAYMITPEFLTTAPYKFEMGGIFPQIIGTLLLVGVCMCFAGPMGVLAAIYLTEYAPNNIITKTLRFFVESLAGIPSIIIGLFGLAFLVYYMHFRISLLSGGLALGFMILPWTVRASEEAIRAVPFSYREASLALGASKWQTIKNVSVQAAFPGIITGLLLGLGKAIGETAVVLLTAGSGLESFLPRSVFEPVASLPVYLYMIATQGHTSEAYTRAYGAALVLLMIFLTINIFASIVRNHYVKKHKVRFG
ncbi:MAG: phosphate ABC transporter permease PstA [Candidatus Bathyarchaeota archaeon]|nr:phosphate ABC transporter permease PstA [Candidatus Bathyarchaeota archaeon]